MPYLQRATNNYFGFMPAQTGQGSLQINPYIVSSSEAGAISLGDVCVGTTIGTVKIAPSGGLSTGFAGVAASILGANAGSTAATMTVNSSQLILLYDDPNQMYVVCDTTSSILSGPLKTGFNCGIVTTGVIGSTGVNSTLNRSVMALSATLASTSAVLPFKIIGLHPIESAYSTVAYATAGAASEVRKYLVQANLTQRTGGFDVVTT